MDRRLFIKYGVSIIGTSGVLASYPVLALLKCSNFDSHRIQQCEAGINSNIANITAASVGGQHMSQWCWAACIEMVFKYYGLHVPQEAIVQQTWGGLVNRPGQPAQILANLNRRWMDSRGQQFSVSGNAYTANPITAAQDLSEDMPLIIGTMGHAMVLTSLQYYVDQWGNGQVSSAVVRDPWPRKGRRILTAQEWKNTSFLARIRIK
ncbi:MAG: papain-like cysteine protease family protein [Cognaticolwellia sp.]